LKGSSKEDVRGDRAAGDRQSNDSILHDRTSAEMVSYVLGELVGERAEEFERRYLGDQDTFELLEAVEEDLIEEYLRGGLSADVRELFERRYMSRPENREKIEFARALLEDL
jgi:hypothetical protein